MPLFLLNMSGGDPGVVVTTAAFHGGLKVTKMFLSHPRVKLSIVGSLRDRKVAYSTSDRQVSNFESCVWRTVSSHSSHHPQEVLLTQFSPYVHKVGLKPDSFHFIFLLNMSNTFLELFLCSELHLRWPPLRKRFSTIPHRNMILVIMILMILVIILNL